jgi:hypothetical protein
MGASSLLDMRVRFKGFSGAAAEGPLEGGAAPPPP